nr:MAG TPA: hypothetical protein [Caudoviricetes sp.]
MRLLNIYNNYALEYIQDNFSPTIKVISSRLLKTRMISPKQIPILN